MIDLFIPDWTPMKAQKYQEHQDRWLLGEVVRHASPVVMCVRDEQAIQEREARLAQLSSRRGKMLRWRA